MDFSKPESAEIYAKFGWFIFPCNWIVNGECSCGNKDCSSKGKHPKTKNGNLDATTDIETIKKWWKQWPDANIAVKTGVDSKIWVLDIDLPDGPDSLKKFDELPSTRTQETGSGGIHYFFKWNGTEVRNSSHKIAPGIDVRGTNGYVLLPPSNHLSGSDYKWLKKESISPPPKWLLSLVAKRDDEQQARPTRNDPSKYGQTALANEIVKLSSCSPGNRNATLNECAFSLSQLVAGGELDESSVRSALLSAAISVGLNESESRKTIESGFKAGLSKPRNGNHETHETHAISPGSRKLTETHGNSRKLTETHGHNDPNQLRFNGNLTASIRDYIKENQGSFTNSDIDRDFGISHQKDKDLRRRALLTLVKEKLIKKDIRVMGRYHILKSEIAFLDLDNIESDPFNVIMPLDLTNMVRIPKKSIIVIAGSTNAGKTALAIEFLRLNLFQKYPLMYLMSEMGPSEYKQRILTAVDDFDKWKSKVMSAPLQSGFDAAIAQHNPNGLTVIDFLEEIEGEYFRIPSDLRAIYDGLEDGIAIVCIQKHSKSDVGRGGEGTAEKPRLYLTIDKLVYDKKSTISAIKIYKAKDYIGDNPNGLERHIAFGKYGSAVTCISDWIYCNATQREKWKQHYEVKGCNLDSEEDGNDLCIYFTTKSGSRVRVIERDLNRWRENYKKINVDLELLKISKNSEEKPFLDDKKWFFQLSGLLSKKNS